MRMMKISYLNLYLIFVIKMENSSFSAGVKRMGYFVIYYYRLQGYGAQLLCINNQGCHRHFSTNFPTKITSLRSLAPSSTQLISKTRVSILSQDINVRSFHSKNLIPNYITMILYNQISYFMPLKNRYYFLPTTFEYNNNFLSSPIY